MQVLMQCQHSSSQWRTQFKVATQNSSQFNGLLATLDHYIKYMHIYELNFTLFAQNSYFVQTALSGEHYKNASTYIKDYC